MKKISVLLVLFCLAFSMQGFAQVNNGAPKSTAKEKNDVPAVFVTLGRLIPVIDKDGKRGLSATRAELLANTKLMPTEPNCSVKSFMFNILPTGGDLLGPYAVLGSELNDKMKTLIKENVGLVFIENITVKCGDKEMPGQSIGLKYDH